MSVRRSAGAVGVGMSIALALTGGWAWACTPQPQVVATSAESGQPGRAVMIRGEAVAPAGAVELRWNAVQGPVIGSAVADASGRFSSEVRIPEAAAGVHTILVVAGGNGVGRTPFEVTPTSASPAKKGAAGWADRSAYPASSEGGRFAVGAAVLGAGAAALSSGAAFAALHRRKELASATR